MRPRASEASEALRVVVAPPFATVAETDMSSWAGSLRWGSIPAGATGYSAMGARQWVSKSVAPPRWRGVNGLVSTGDLPIHCRMPSRAVRASASRRVAPAALSGEVHVREAPALRGESAP